jgi:lysylphosphatidylglycerol synthetase-like protein (DUF2156 family)
MVRAAIPFHSVELSERAIVRLRNGLCAIFTLLFFVLELPETPLPGWWRAPLDLLFAYIFAAYFVAWIGPPLVLLIERFAARATSRAARDSDAGYPSMSASPPALHAAEPVRKEPSR